MQLPGIDIKDLGLAHTKSFYRQSVRGQPERPSDLRETQIRENQIFFVRSGKSMRLLYYRMI